MTVMFASAGAADRHSFDEWLWDLLPSVRERFQHKWLVDHVASCKLCSACFGYGLDGKRGMKRFVCACLDKGSVFVPEIDAFLSVPCGKKPLRGSLYCFEDDESSEDSDVDLGGKILEHRRSQNGTVEYLVHWNVGEEYDGSMGRARQWLGASDIGKPLVRKYEKDRLDVNTKTSKKKRRKPTVLDSGIIDKSHVLFEHDCDRGACGIDKAAAQSSVQKWRRRQLGGIIAAVSGCRVFLDWAEHHGGEGTSEVYMLLARSVEVIERSKASRGVGRLPDVVFMDNACALMAFAQNVRRAARTATTKIVARLRFMLDIWHVTNHTACLKDAERAKILDPRLPENAAVRKAVNTEACEQAFSFLDRISYVGLNMNRGSFHLYLYLLMDRENTKVCLRRSV